MPASGHGVSVVYLESEAGFYGILLRQFDGRVTMGAPVLAYGSRSLVSSCGGTTQNRR